MVWRCAVALGFAGAVALASSAAQAAEPPSVEAARVERRADPWGVESSTPYVRLELDGIGSPGVWPNPSLGGDVAIVAGRPKVHARIGVGAMATPGFTLGERAKVGTVLETSDLQGCAASHYRLHRVSLCAGMQAGVMHVRWSGFAAPGRRDLPWVAAVGGGSYGIALGRVVDLHAGIGLGVPLVRPRLVTRTRGGVDVEPTGLVFSTFRIGLGFRLG
jgi:hypothetical protein